MFFEENEITGCNYIILVKWWWWYAQRNAHKLTRAHTHNSREKMAFLPAFLNAGKLWEVRCGSCAGRVNPVDWAPDKSTSSDFLWFWFLSIGPSPSSYDESQGWMLPSVPWCQLQNSRVFCVCVWLYICVSSQFWYDSISTWIKVYSEQYVTSRWMLRIIRTFMLLGPWYRRYTSLYPTSFTKPIYNTGTGTQRLQSEPPSFAHAHANTHTL